jgi:hypothetical protein
MITKSFIFLPGIGQVKERRIWDGGIHSWEDFLETEKVGGITAKRKPFYDAELEKAVFYRDIRSPVYFARTVPKKEQWRLFETFPDRVLYLDIETTGLSPHRSQVTVVGIHDGRETVTLVKGEDLTEENLLAEFDGVKMLVTFYGSAFDVPFLLYHFPSLKSRLEVPHFDLCFAGRRLGLTGGLKNIERRLGIQREEDLEGVDGFEAVRLWRRWERRGEEAARDILLEYNRADTEGLSTVARHIYGRLKEITFPMP